MKRLLLKKWYKLKQNHHSKNFNSYWYMRFGWLNSTFNNTSQLTSLFEIHSPHKLTFADCFYVMENDRHFIFFEEVNDSHPVGFLSVIEIFKNGTYTEPETILKLDYHLSYPCVFKVDNDWYMIPETHQNKTVELWKCTDFPLRWEKHSNLLENIQAVDSTPFYHDGLWYLFTSTRRNCKKFGDRLDLFFTEDILSPKWQEHPQNPVCKGHQQFRMAGKPFIYNGKLVRPSQDSLKRYGGNIELKEIVELSPTSYKEKLSEIVLPNWNNNDNGCHTINVEGNFVVLDAIRVAKK